MSHFKSRWSYRQDQTSQAAQAPKTMITVGDGSTVHRRVLRTSCSYLRRLSLIVGHDLPCSRWHHRGPDWNARNGLRTIRGGHVSCVSAGSKSTDGTADIALGNEAARRYSGAPPNGGEAGVRLHEVLFQVWLWQMASTFKHLCAAPSNIIDPILRSKDLTQWHSPQL